MKKSTLLIASCISVCAALVVLLVWGSLSGGTGEHIHTFAEEWTYDETYHWHTATCEHTGEISDKGEHDEAGEVIITPATDTATGLAQYTCSVCGYTYEKVLLIGTEIVTAPAIGTEKIYVGMKLSDIALSGGTGSVAGTFAWTNPEETVSASGEYSVTFTPDNADYAVSTCTLYIEAEQLTVTVSTGENGLCSPDGTVNVNYGEDFTVTFTPNLGYAVADIMLDGVSVGAKSKYTIENVRESHTLYATFEEGEMTVSIECAEGTGGAYSIAGNTITFTGITADSVYTISGEMVGNIVIDVGDDYQFELEMRGLTLSSDLESPIVILSGDKVTLTAKKDTENFIYDLREAVDDADETVYSAAVYSLADLDIGGKGALTLESKNNNGIHTKDDLEIKNLTLSVTCEDNALKGNDSVTILGGTLTLIARTGDGIKTTNSDISAKGNQRGTVTVSGGSLDIYAACDGIDAAYNVVIDETESTPVINIRTDKYSEYSEDVESSGTSANERYIAFTYRYYNFSVKYYNSESDYVWVNAEYHSSVSSGRSTYYVFSYPVMENYSKIQVFMYSDGQEQGQEESYTVCTDYITYNDSYDTFALSRGGNRYTYNWVNYSSLSMGGGMGGPGGMGGGMQDGNSDKGDYSTKGIKAANEIIISAGNINIKSYDDAIHANSENELENGESATGSVYISGGTLTLYSNDDGIHADGSNYISGGTVNITNCYEGIEGAYNKISGGDVSIIAKDDGINGTATSGTTIEIGGGTVYIYCSGDGVDSNSRTQSTGLIISGGNTVVISTSNGNSALDTEAGYTYTAGSVIAIMPSGGMSGETTNCKNFSSVGTKTTKSLSSGSYLTVSAGDVSATVKMPTSISGMVVYLGSNSASISTSSSASVSLDANGVYWSK